MSGEFNWWLLVVGLVAGGVLTWLVLADSGRRDEDIADVETIAEAAWIARALDDPLVDDEVAERILRAHRRYKGFPPPDELVEPRDLVALERTHAASGDPER